jgi:hypothetical protein
MIFVVVSLDPFQAHETHVHFPLDRWAWRLGPAVGGRRAADGRAALLAGLGAVDPAGAGRAGTHLPGRRVARSEQDFDYFMEPTVVAQAGDG